MYFLIIHMFQEYLSLQLTLRQRLQRMAEISPVGMVSFSPEGVILEANERYYEISGLPRDASSEMSWLEAISDGSRHIAEQGWERLTVDRLPWSAELVTSFQFNNYV